MTYDQIKGIRFRFVSHLEMPDFHYSQCVADNVPFSLMMETAAPTEEYRQEHPKARCTRRYMLNGVWISDKKLIENLRSIEL